METNNHAQRLRVIASEMTAAPGRADDIKLAAKEIDRLVRRVDELEGFIKGLAINCAIVARNEGG